MIFVLYWIIALISVPIFYKAWVSYVAKNLGREEKVGNRDVAFIFVETVLCALIWPVVLALFSLKVIATTPPFKGKIQKAVDKKRQTK